MSVSFKLKVDAVPKSAPSGKINSFVDKLFICSQSSKDEKRNKVIPYQKARVFSC